MTEIRYVILRDDDTNALTPVEYLERLFRPFLLRQLPVTLAVIPNVKASTMVEDVLEQFLMMRKADTPETVPISDHPELVRYILSHSGYHLAAHGYHHEFREFTSSDGQDLAMRLDLGLAEFKRAGLPRPRTFVAPQDKLSKAAICEVVKRFPVLSTSWLERHQLPLKWWPHLVMKKLLHRHHWCAGNQLFISRPLQQVSYLQCYDTILERVKEQVESHKLLVLLTHWWEFFRNGKPDEPLIAILHQVADYLATHPRVRVITFDDLLENRELFHQLR